MLQWTFAGQRKHLRFLKERSRDKQNLNKIIEGKQRYTIKLWIITFKCILNVICAIFWVIKVNKIRIMQFQTLRKYMS